MNNGSYVKRTGILGGTFNPIHIGHLLLAQNALEFCELDRVLIMPSGCSYLKDPQTIADTGHRINMTALAIKDNARFELSTIETDRPGNSYTCETLEYLCEKEPDTEFYYIIGADTLFTIDTWKDPQGIFNRCRIVCARRGGYSDSQLMDRSAYLKDRFNADIILMDCVEMPVSSTDIRNLLKKGHSCKYYLDDKVIEYIRINGLYGIDSN